MELAFEELAFEELRFLSVLGKILYCTYPILLNHVEPLSTKSLSS